MPRRRWASLRRAADIRRVHQFGTRLWSGPVTAWLLPHDGATCRAALAVRVQGLGHVARNRLRRQLRSILDDVLPDRGWDLVVSVRAPAPSGVLREALSEIAGRASGPSERCPEVG